MCGIAGTVGAFTLSTDSHRVLDHRGPNDSGKWNDDLVDLLSWRLAVIDLTPAGHQPMVSHSGRYVIAFNGEIYNFPDLREEITACHLAMDDDFAWKGRCDTEVVLEGFALWGATVFARLNGMFGVAVYDRTEKRLHLARDRAGIKPLYVWTDAGRVAFASEAKFFFTLQEFNVSVSNAGLASFLLYGHGFGKSRILDGVRQLWPGEILNIDASAGIPSSFSMVATSGGHRPPPDARRIDRKDPEAAAATLRKLLAEAVERQLVADVPVGVFLSGGVDSSILAALTARVLGPGNTKAFTLAYRGQGADFDEAEEARAVAKHLGISHYTYEAGTDDLLNHIDHLVWHYDEPFGDAAALNMMVLSRAVKTEVTVALAGEGADELFGGYRRYRLESWLRAAEPAAKLIQWGLAVPRLARLSTLPRRLAILLRSLAHEKPARRYSAYFESGIDVQELVRPEWRTEFDPRHRLDELYPMHLDGSSAVAALLRADQQFWLVDDYLEKSDKGSMAYSLEVRVPFLDNGVVEFANDLPDHFRIKRAQGKWILREAFAGIVPDRVFTRMKRGFGVPLASWFRKELKDYFADYVLADDSRIRQYLQPSVIERYFDEHQKRRHDRSLILWYVLLFEKWLRLVESGFERPAANEAPITFNTVRKAGR